MNDEIEYIYNQVGETRIFQFPLSGKATEVVDNYLAIQILHKVTLLMYNSEKEESDVTAFDPEDKLSELNY